MGWRRPLVTRGRAERQRERRRCNGAPVLRPKPLKILQEDVIPFIFVPFFLFYLKGNLFFGYLLAGVCLLAAVFSLFRGLLSDG
jgi:uncharacterized protein (DUF486 family)